MKNIKFLITLVILVLISFSCEKENNNSFYKMVPFKMYKTKGDYFNYANTWTISDNGPTMLRVDSYKVSIINEDTVYNWRWKLNNGYVLGVEINDEDYFTDVTFKEIVKYNEEHNYDGFPTKELYKREIDNDPFTEFYFMDDGYFNSVQNIDTTFLKDSINKIIDANMLEEIFTRTK